MKRASKWVIGSAVGIVLMAGTAFAETKWNVWINNSSFAADYLGIKQEDGKVMVPIDRIAKEFQGKATIDLAKKEVKVTLPDAAQQSHQINRLEDALRASTPKEALDTWVKGIQSRNGALQYAVFSPELRERTKADFDEHYWVTGGSSPHMDTIEKLQTKTINDTTIEYSFDYNLVAAGYHAVGKAVVTVQKISTERGEGWFITQVKMQDPGDTGITIGVDQL